MRSYFVPHKLQAGDVTHLSDEDSEIIIERNLHQIEDPIEVSNLQSIFLAVITNIEKKSVEVEIIKKLEDRKIVDDKFHLTLMQSISADQKFHLILEKAVEIGIHRIIPVESKYSTQSKNKCIKKYGVWRKIIQDAKEQSRNPFDIDLEKPLKLKELSKIETTYNICLSTESLTSKSLQETLNNKNPSASYTIAIGPEKGWSSSDLKVFENLNFEFTKMGGNILRTETGGLVIGSILNFRNGKY